MTIFLILFVSIFGQSLALKFYQRNILAFVCLGIRLSR